MVTMPMFGRFADRINAAMLNCCIKEYIFSKAAPGISVFIEKGVTPSLIKPLDSKNHWLVPFLLFCGLTLFCGFTVFLLRSVRSFAVITSLCCVRTGGIQNKIGGVNLPKVPANPQKTSRAKSV